MTKYSDLIRAHADKWIDDHNEGRLTTYAGNEVPLPPKKCKGGRLYIFSICSEGQRLGQVYNEITKDEVIYSMSNTKCWGNLTSTQFNAIYKTILALSPLLSEQDIYEYNVAKDIYNIGNC